MLLGALVASIFPVSVLQENTHFTLVHFSLFTDLYTWGGECTRVFDFYYFYFYTLFTFSVDGVEGSLGDVEEVDLLSVSFPPACRTISLIQGNNCRKLITT